MLIATQHVGFMGGGDPSKYPVIVSQHTFNEIGVNTSCLVTMPATVNAGDLLVVCISGWNASSATGYFTPSGWSLSSTDAGTGTMRRLCVFYKVAAGTEGGTTVNFVTNNNCFGAAVVYRITGYTGTPEVGTAAAGTSSAPDSPSLTPSWGAKKTLWIATAGIYNASQTATTLPSGYSDLYQDFGNSTGQDRPRIATANLFKKAASENPPAFGTSADNWAAQTVAIQGLAA